MEYKAACTPVKEGVNGSPDRGTCNVLGVKYDKNTCAMTGMFPEVTTSKSIDAPGSTNHPVSGAYCETAN